LTKTGTHSAPGPESEAMIIATHDITPDYEQLAQIFRALGHPVRLGILAKTLSGEFCVTDLQEQLARRQANVSQHLAILRNRGLAAPERRGNKVCYRLADERIAQLIDLAADIANTIRGVPSLHADKLK